MKLRKPEFPWIVMPDVGSDIRDASDIELDQPKHWGLFDRPLDFVRTSHEVIRQNVPILRMYNVAPDTAAIAANARYQAQMAAQSRRLGAPLAASPTRTTPPQSGGKREAPQRASGDAKHRRAHKCPKGHYWSYKKKKCVKSKF